MAHLTATAATGVLGETIPVKLFKNPNCFCCDLYAQHLNSEGFKVDIINTNDMTKIKETHGVPEKLEGWRSNKATARLRQTVGCLSTFISNCTRCPIRSQSDLAESLRSGDTGAGCCMGNAAHSKNRKRRSCAQSSEFVAANAFGFGERYRYEFTSRCE